MGSIAAMIVRGVGHQLARVMLSEIDGGLRSPLRVAVGLDVFVFAK